MKKEITQEYNDLPGPSVWESATKDPGTVAISLISYNKIVQMKKKATENKSRSYNVVLKWERGI